MSRIAVINVPYKLCTSTEGAASLHIGHSIAILRKECREVECVDYMDYNFDEFFAFSSLVFEYIEAYKSKYFKNLQKYEALDAMTRIILEKMMGIDNGINMLLGIPNDDIAKIIEATECAFFRQLENIRIGNYDSIILFAANNTSLLLIFTKLIQRYKNKSEIIVIDQFTFEPVTPYLQSVYTHKDIVGNDIRIFQKYDLLNPVLEKCIGDMIDTIVVGEGYDYLRKRFGSTENASISHERDEAIFYSSNGGRCYIIQSERIELDKLPFPDYSDMSDIYEFADIEFQRGCAFECVFCERTRMMGRSVKYHSSEYIVKMIKHIMSYGFKKFTVIDCAMNNNQKYMIDVLKAIDKEHFDIEYQGNLRTQETSDEFIILLKQTGCSVIALGIENGSEEVLKSMNKKQSIPKMKELLKKLSANEISLMLFLIIGFPTETINTISSSAALLDEIKEYVNIEIVEIEYYHAGHIQKLQPNVFDEYGIEWKNPYEKTYLRDSSFNFFTPGVFGSAIYKKGMSRLELYKATELYKKYFSESGIKLGMIYY